MKNYGRLATVFVAMVFVLAFSSCEKEQAESKTIDVSFDIASLSDGSSMKSAMENGDPGSANDENYPECTDLATDYVVVTIDGVDYTLEMTSLSESQTEVVQLVVSNTNKVTSFEAFNYDQTEPLYVAPDTSSLEVTEGGLLGVPFTINTEAWNKEAIDIDVVCWHPYSYQNYAWNWFKIDYNQVKSICFFGDVCTKFYTQFGATGYDLPAHFTVALTYTNSLGVRITNTVTTQNGTGNWINEEGPLCISYIDDLNQAENATYDLTLHTPTGDILLVDDGVIAEGTWSEIGKADGFGGDDGIYLFNVGNCGIDEDGQFPSYLPLPDDVKMEVGINSTHNFWLTVTEATSGQNLHMLTDIIKRQAWCLDEQIVIYTNKKYDARVFSSLDLAKLMADASIHIDRRNRFNNLPWGAINYMINHLDELPAGLTLKQIQHAFWYITDNYDALPAVKSKIDEWKTTHANWTPKVGDDAVVFLVPSVNSEDQTIPVQAFGVRIDP